MYVVNIVPAEGYDCVPLTGLHWALSLSFFHTHTNHKHTSFQNATEVEVHRGRKYKLFNWNIISEVHSHLILIP